MRLYQQRAKELAIYPGQGTLDGLAYAALGLAGEAGEFANKVKKVLRMDTRLDDPETKARLVDELGDTLWYVSQLATELGTTLTQVAERNLEKLEGRTARSAIQGNGDVR